MATHTNPEWVQVDGRIRHVGEFEGLPIGERPLAHCTECGARVDLKLGPVRRPHYAHRSDSPTPCSLTSGESALHLNTKYELFTRLKGLQQLDIAHPCRGCGQVESYPWLVGWDGVQVEKAVPGSLYRPDISLWRQGKVVAAVEIFVTHAVDPITQRFYEEQGIQWIEVGGGVEREWQVGGPKRYRRIHPAPDERTCERCAEVYRARREREEALSLRPRLDQQQGAAGGISYGYAPGRGWSPPAAEERPYSWRVVDNYHDTGIVLRDVHRLSTRHGPRGEPVGVAAVWIRDGREVEHRAAYTPATSAAQGTLQQWLAEFRAIAQSAPSFAFARPRGWQSYRGAASDEDPARFPLEYMWGGHKRGWVPTLAHGDAA